MLRQCNGLLLSFEMAHVSLRRKVYSSALLFLIIIITANHLHCFFAALTVSAGSYFTLPDHQPLQLGVTMATVVSFSAPSFPVGIGPPAVTCRKISTPVCTHTHTHSIVLTHIHAEQKYINIKQKSHRCLYTQSAHSEHSNAQHGKPLYIPKEMQTVTQ